MPKIKSSFKNLWHNENNAIEKIKKYLPENIGEEIKKNKAQFINGSLTEDFKTDKKIICLNFSLINFHYCFFLYRRINVHVGIEGLNNLKISICTPYSTGYSFYKKKLEKIVLEAIKKTLPSPKKLA